MMTATPCQQKPVGFRTAASLFKLSNAITYRKMEFVINDQGSRALEGSTEFIVIFPGIERATKKPYTVVFPADESGQSLSWMGIGKSMEGHPEPAEVLERLGYKLN